MTVETLPHFTAPATKLWKAIPPDARKLLISNVWCGKCRHEVTITNFSGAVRGGGYRAIPAYRLKEWHQSRRHR